MSSGKKRKKNNYIETDNPIVEQRERENILITGICGKLGWLLARALHKDYIVHGLDRRPSMGLPKDVIHHQIDVRRKKVEDIFRTHEIKAFIHLGTMHNPRADENELYTFNVVGFSSILEYCKKYPVPKVIVLSSSNVYGPNPDNSMFLTEDSPLRADETDPTLRSLVAVDRIAQNFFWQNPDRETVILRPVHIVGPSVHNAPSNLMRREWFMSVMGFDPIIQLIHEKDVVHSIMLALRSGGKGIFNVVGPGVAYFSSIIKELKQKTIPVPEPFATKILNVLWKLKFTSFPTPEINHIKFNCTVDGEKANKVLGFQPQYSLKDTIHSIKIS